MDIAGIDTCIAIWGVQEIATEGQEAMIMKARCFLEDLQNQGCHVVMPSVVAGEFLAGVPAGRQAEFGTKLTSRFRIVPYDMAAATWAARIWAEKHGMEGLRELLGDVTKRKIHADLKIVATALAQEVDVLYTHDDNVIKLASAYLVARNMPDQQVQLDLYGAQPAPLTPEATPAEA